MVEFTKIIHIFDNKIYQFIKYLIAIASLWKEALVSDFRNRLYY